MGGDICSVGRADCSACEPVWGVSQALRRGAWGSWGRVRRLLPGWWGCGGAWGESRCCWQLARIGCETEYRARLIAAARPSGGRVTEASRSGHLMNLMPIGRSTSSGAHSTIWRRPVDHDRLCRSRRYGTRAPTPKLEPDRGRRRSARTNRGGLLELDAACKRIADLGGSWTARA